MLWVIYLCVFDVLLSFENKITYIAYNAFFFCLVGRCTNAEPTQNYHRHCCSIILQTYLYQYTTTTTTTTYFSGRACAVKDMLCNVFLLQQRIFLYFDRSGTILYDLYHFDSLRCSSFPQIESFQNLYSVAGCPSAVIHFYSSFWSVYES